MFGILKYAASKKYRKIFKIIEHVFLYFDCMYNVN